MASQTLVAVLFFLLFALRSAGYHQKVSPSLQSAIEASFGDELKRSVNSPSPSKIWVDFSSNPRLSFDNMVKSVLSVDGVISERVRYWNYRWSEGVAHSQSRNTCCCFLQYSRRMGSREDNSEWNCFPTICRSSRNCSDGKRTANRRRDGRWRYQIVILVICLIFSGFDHSRNQQKRAASAQSYRQHLKIDELLNEYPSLTGGMSLLFFLFLSLLFCLFLRSTLSLFFFISPTLSYLLLIY